MIINEIPPVIHAMESIDGAAHITRGWPKSLARLPCIAVQEASNRPMKRYDNRPYIDTIEIDIRVFCVKFEEMDAICPQIEAQMEAMDYERIIAFDQLGFEINMKVMRYRKSLAARGNNDS